MDAGNYDWVVIGSGFGGSIMACRLAQAGASVLVLERGRRWAAAEFPRTTAEVASEAFWDEDRARFGLLDYHVFPGMHVIHGVGVGGGSLHYFNVHIRPPASIFDDPRWPAAINLDTLDPYYDLARSMLGAAPLVPPPDRVMPKRTTVFCDACFAAGRAPELVPIAVDAPVCDYSGNCGLGCATRAKNTLDHNYLAVAEAHGARIAPLHLVESIEPLAAEGVADGGYRVRFRVLDGDRPGSSEPGFVEAGRVVVAGGTLGTCELLLRCRDVHGTLPDLSPALGHGFSGNGDLLLSGGWFGDRDVDAGSGPSITAGVNWPSAAQEAYIEDLGLPQALFWFVEGMLGAAELPLQAVSLLKLWRADWDRLHSATRRLMDERDRLLGGGRTRRFLPYLGMCQDASDGWFGLARDGSLALHWDVRASAANLLEVERAMCSLTESLGGVYVPSPLWVGSRRELLTAHPLGGCRMSADALSGVVDEFGAVHGYTGLYVADGSIVPTALARNPTATISALAERIAFNVLHGRDLRERDPARPINRLAEPERTPL